MKLSDVKWGDPIDPEIYPDSPAWQHIHVRKSDGDAATVARHPEGWYQITIWEHARYANGRIGERIRSCGIYIKMNVLEFKCWLEDYEQHP